MLVAGGLILGYFYAMHALKPLTEVIMTQEIGVPLLLNGKLRVSVLGGIRIYLEDVVLMNESSHLVSARQAKIRLDARALLKKEIRISRLEIKQALVTFGQNRLGKYNFQIPPPETPEVLAKPHYIKLPPIDRVRVTQGIILYQEERSGSKLLLAGFEMNVDKITEPGESITDFLQEMTIVGDLAFARLQTNRFQFSNMAFRMSGQNGRLHLSRILPPDTQGAWQGGVDIDISGGKPALRVDYRISRYPLENLISSFSEKEILTGNVNFSLQLTAQGRNEKELLQTLDGRLSMTGEQLVVYGANLDTLLEKFDNTQNYNLVDIGSIFFLGFLGPLITKGYDFAKLYQAAQSGVKSEVRELRTDFVIRKGVMDTRDVALSTAKNRIVLKGKIDLPQEKFDEVTFALVDQDGCATMTQEVNGSFKKPDIQGISIIAVVLGPIVRGVSSIGESIFGKPKCSPFYTGEVRHPE